MGLHTATIWVTAFLLGHNFLFHNFLWRNSDIFNQKEIWSHHAFMGKYRWNHRATIDVLFWAKCSTMLRLNFEAKWYGMSMVSPWWFTIHVTIFRLTPKGSFGSYWWMFFRVLKVFSSGPTWPKRGQDFFEGQKGGIKILSPFFFHLRGISFLNTLMNIF